MRTWEEEITTVAKGTPKQLLKSTNKNFGNFLKFLIAALDAQQNFMLMTRYTFFCFLYLLDQKL